jgi:hypothetical protein
MKHILVFYEINDENYESFVNSIKEKLKNNDTVKDYSCDERVDESGNSSLWSAYFHDL